MSGSSVILPPVIDSIPSYQILLRPPSRVGSQPFPPSHLRKPPFPRKKLSAPPPRVIRNMTGTADTSSSLAKLAPIEAVLFDVDGTLCDTDPIHHRAFAELLQEINYNNGEPISEDFFIKNITGKHNEEIAKFLFPEDIPRGIKFMVDKETHFRKLAADHITAIEGLYKVKKWIEDHGLKRAAVTNAPKHNADLMISKLGLTDFFQAVILGDDCEHAKPHPEPYQKALEVLQVSKEHTFVFEDSVSGIKAGVAAGMPVIGITTRNPEDLLMQAKPTFLIKNYADPKLWAALEEVDKAMGAGNGASA